MEFRSCIISREIEMGSEAQIACSSSPSTASTVLLVIQGDAIPVARPGSLAGEAQPNVSCQQLLKGLVSTTGQRASRVRDVGKRADQCPYQLLLSLSSRSQEATISDGQRGSWVLMTGFYTVAPQWSLVSSETEALGACLTGRLSFPSQAHDNGSGDSH